MSKMKTICKGAVCAGTLIGSLIDLYDLYRKHILPRMKKHHFCPETVTEEVEQQGFADIEA